MHVAISYWTLSLSLFLLWAAGIGLSAAFFAAELFRRRWSPLAQPRHEEEQEEEEEGEGEDRNEKYEVDRERADSDSVFSPPPQRSAFNSTASTASLRTIYKNKEETEYSDTKSYRPVQ